MKRDSVVFCICDEISRNLSFFEGTNILLSISHWFYGSMDTLLYIFLNLVMYF